MQRLFWVISLSAFIFTLSCASLPDQNNNVSKIEGIWQNVKNSSNLIIFSNSNYMSIVNGTLFVKGTFSFEDKYLTINITHIYNGNVGWELNTEESLNINTYNYMLNTNYLELYNELEEHIFKKL